MRLNLGKADRAVRIILGLVIGALFFMNIVTGTLGIVLLILAAVFILTSFAGVCPLYLPFGIKTCSKD